MTLRIAIDREACIGSGNCTRIAPGVFALDAEEIATVVDPAAASEEDVLDAEATCPTGAITVEGDA